MTANAYFAANFTAQIFTFTADDFVWQRALLRATGPNGTWVHSVYLYNRSGSAIQFNLSYGKIRTRAEDMGTGAISGNTNIVRTAGSFIEDGWKAGMYPLLLAPKAPEDQLSPQIVSVTDTQLSFVPNRWPSNILLNAGACLIQSSLLMRQTVPSNSRLKLLDKSSNAGFVPGQFLTLGMGDFLLGSVLGGMSVNSGLDVTLGAVDLAV